jgi:hypothetical protein
MLAKGTDAGKSNNLSMSEMTANDQDMSPGLPKVKLPHVNSKAF